MTKRREYEESKLPHGPVLVRVGKAFVPAYYDNDDEVGRAIVYFGKWDDGYRCVDPKKVFSCPKEVWDAVKEKICPEIRRSGLARQMGINLDVDEKE